VPIYTVGQGNVAQLTGKVREFCFASPVGTLVSMFLGEVNMFFIYV